VLDIALFGSGPKIQTTMNEISADRQGDSSGRERWGASTIATNALLGVLASFLVAQLAPWGDGDVAATTGSLFAGMAAGVAIGFFGRPRILIILDASLLVVYLLVTPTDIVSQFTEKWVRIDPLPADTLDAVIALSAGIHTNSALNTVAADRLLSALELMRDATNRQSHREDADYQFHLAIARAARNSYFSTAMEALKDHIAVGMKFHGMSVKREASGLTRVFAEHEAIAVAIAEGDAEAARRLMHDHLTGSRDRLFESSHTD